MQSEPLVDPTLVSQFRTVPYDHQLLGVRKLLERPAFALFDEMGVGKTKQAIDAICCLNHYGLINTGIVVAPSSVRPSWLNPEFGEIQKHCWRPWVSYEYHIKGLVKVAESRAEPPRLIWIITNYEYLRRRANLDRLIELLKKRKVMLVLDESIFIKNPKAIQTKAVFKLRQVCERATILNGTPIGNNPTDLYSQFKVLDPKIIPSPNFWAFRNRYCKMGGYMNKQIIGYQNIRELQNVLRPFVLRRKKEDCLDLPDKIYTILEAHLTPATWKIYKQMRDDMVAWLDSGEVSSAAQAIVKMIRLRQITSGLLGGLDTEDPAPKVVGTEKLDIIATRVEEGLEEEPNFRAIFWCFFKAEQEYLAQRLKKLLPVFRIYGKQKKVEREAAIKELSIGANQPAVLIGQQGAGGFGLNLVTADKVFYVSNDWSYMTRKQSEDRVHRPGQKKNVIYTDVLATGPEGQKTIDHALVRALRNKEDVANWTTDTWRQVLLEE